MIAIRQAHERITEASSSLYDALESLTGLEPASKEDYFLISGERILDLRSGYHRLEGEGVKPALENDIPEGCR